MSIHTHNTEENRKAFLEPPSFSFYRVIIIFPPFLLHVIPVHSRIMIPSLALFILEGILGT